MKSDFTKQINTINQARLFLNNLLEDNLMFHLESNPHEILNSNEEPLFTTEQANLLELRLSEVFDKLDDPCEYVVEHPLYIKMTQK